MLVYIIQTFKSKKKQITGKTLARTKENHLRIKGLTNTNHYHVICYVAWK